MSNGSKCFRGKTVGMVHDMWGREAILNTMVREGYTKIAFEQKPEGAEGIYGYLKKAVYWQKEQEVYRLWSGSMPAMLLLEMEESGWEGK